MQLALRVEILMRTYLFRSTILLFITTVVAGAQSDAPKSSPRAAEVAANAPDKADKLEKSADIPAVPAKPAPVKYTELKKTLWPPKAGVKTPGVQIPIVKIRPEAEIALSGLPGSLVFTADQVLITIPTADQIARVEGRSNKLLDAFSGVVKPCGGLVNAFKSVWAVSCGAQGLARLETATGKALASIASGSASVPYALAASPDSIWALTDDRTTLTRIDPDTNSIVSEMRLPAGCRSITYADNSLWVACPGEKKLIRINPQTNVVAARIEVTPEPISVVYGGASAAESSIWVLSRKEGKVARIDSKTNKVTATIELGFTNADGNLAFGDGFLWVSAPGFPITKISTQLEKEKVVQQFAGDGGGMIQFGLNSVWLTNTAYNNVWRIDPKRIAATLAE
jgi:DNA-binding beta-propeller fold protein YncE